MTKEDVIVLIEEALDLLEDTNKGAGAVDNAISVLHEARAYLINEGERV
jgi:hypothetical protein